MSFGGDRVLIVFNILRRNGRLHAYACFKALCMANYFSFIYMLCVISFSQFTELILFNFTYFLTCFCFASVFYFAYHRANELN